MSTNNQSNLEIFYEVIDKGQTYNTVRERYPSSNSAYCDFCQKTLSPPFIGYDKTDLCLGCSNTLTMYMANISVPSGNQTPMPEPIPAPISDRSVNNVMTRMQQGQFSINNVMKGMQQGQFATRMQQRQFTNVQVKKAELATPTMTTTN